MLHLPPCIYLNQELGMVECSTCAGKVKIKSFSCDLHGKCTIGKPAPGHHLCWKCDDMTEASKESMVAKQRRFVESIPRYPAKRFQGRGVVIAGGGERYFPGVFIAIKALRATGSDLPVEVWYLGRNDEMPAKYQAIMDELGVRTVDADEVAKTHPARRLNGWELKIFATLHSAFEEVLFLDSDAYPVADPIALFDNPPHQELGATFWCDTQDDGRLHWDWFDAKKDPKHGSIESGGFLIHKRKCWRALNLAWYFNDHSEHYYPHCFGDKHTFEAAFAHLGQDWHQGGDGRGWWRWGINSFAGPNGKEAIIHRCMDKWKYQSQKYNTRQHGAKTVFHRELPMEALCFSWLSELAVKLEINRDHLQLHCKENPIPGAVNHDIKRYWDFVDSDHDLAVKPWPWPDNSFIRIQWDDGLEHYGDLVATMNELHRVAKPGSLLSIEFPDCLSENAFIDPSHRLRLHPKTFEFFTPDGFGNTNRFHSKKWKLLKTEKIEVGGGPHWRLDLSPIK